MQRRTVSTGTILAVLALSAAILAIGIRSSL